MKTNNPSHEPMTTFPLSPTSGPKSSRTDEIYLLGRSSKEADRLLSQSRFFQSETIELLDSIELPESPRLIDVGCGPLGVLDELALRAGDSGLAVGLEKEEKFVSLAETELSRTGFGDASVLQGDARDTKLPDHYFDLTHSRLLLVNLPRPQEIVKEMTRITKPGGTLVLHEVDWTSWICDPFIDEWERLKEAAQCIWKRNHLDVHLGRKLPAMLRAEGASDIQTRPMTYAWKAGDLKYGFLLSVIDRIREDLLRTNHFGHQELSTLEIRLKKHLSHPDTRVISPTYVQAWGTAPRA